MNDYMPFVYMLAIGIGGYICGFFEGKRKLKSVNHLEKSERGIGE